MIKRTEYIFYCKRAIPFLSSSKILTPPSPSPPGESVLPPQQRRGIHTRRAERGMGGQYFGRRGKQDCPLTVKYVLCDLTYLVRLCCREYKRKQRGQCHEGCSHYIFCSIWYYVNFVSFGLFPVSYFRKSRQKLIYRNFFLNPKLARLGIGLGLLDRNRGKHSRVSLRLVLGLTQQ